MPDRCPCGTGRTLADCCGPYHAGAEPPDAESLMRSRFAAYVRHDWAYLWRTLHADHVDKIDQVYAAWVEHVAASTAPLQFRKLLVIATAPVDRDGFAHVLFHVDVRAGKNNRSFAEHSRFTHDGTGWRYVDGVTLDDREVPRPLATLTFDRFGHAAYR
jgi:SEC-C motif-containing protein